MTDIQMFTYYSPAKNGSRPLREAFDTYLAKTKKPLAQIELAKKVVEEIAKCTGWDVKSEDVRFAIIFDVIETLVPKREERGSIVDAAVDFFDWCVRNGYRSDYVELALLR